MRTTFTIALAGLLLAGCGRDAGELLRRREQEVARYRSDFEAEVDARHAAEAQLAQARQDLDRAAAERDRLAGELAAREAAARVVPPEQAALEAALRDELASGTARIARDGKATVVTLLAAALFAPAGSATLAAGGEAVLRRLAPALSAAGVEGARLSIEASAAAGPGADERRAWQLAGARASAVARALGAQAPAPAARAAVLAASGAQEEVVLRIAGR